VCKLLNCTPKRNKNRSGRLHEGLASMKSNKRNVNKLVDDDRDKLYDDAAIIFPVLDSKVLDIDVTGVLSKDQSVNHVDG